MCLPKFDIYQGAVTAYYFKNHANFWFPEKMFCMMSDLKFPLPHVISFLPDNLFGLKKNYIHTWFQQIQAYSEFWHYQFK